MEIATAAIILVAILHIVFFILESVLWTAPKVRRIFNNTEEEAEATRIPILNQGFYNLGAAIMLLWFLHTDNTPAVMAVLLFLTGMGLVGGLSAMWTIFLIQMLPALAAFILLWNA